MLIIILLSPIDYLYIFLENSLRMLVTGLIGSRILLRVLQLVGIEGLSARQILDPNRVSPAR
jgi:hypothetical protein